MNVPLQKVNQTHSHLNVKGSEKSCCKGSWKIGLIQSPTGRNMEDKTRQAKEMLITRVMPSPTRCRLASEDIVTEQGANAKVLYGWTTHRTLDEIQTLVVKFPSCLTCKNRFGQTPLHVAAARGIQCDILLFMLLMYPQAGWIKDSTGKLPLHYLASSSRWIIPATLSPSDDEEGSDEEEEDEATQYDPHYAMLLKAACAAYPQGATHEDHDGMNPIELAVTDDVPNFAFLRVLQRAASKHWKNVKKGARASTTATKPTNSKRRRHDIAGCAA